MVLTNATVIAAYGRRVQLRLDDGRKVDARMKGRQLRLVCADRVLAEPIQGEDDWLVTAAGDRRNALTRPDRRGVAEVLAANVDLLVVVAAVTPRPDWFIVDRYVCAAETMRARSAVIFNKTDLGEPGEVLQEFAALGYPTVACSAATGQGFDKLSALLDGLTTIVVGQSGVGKSSIVNRITGADAQRTAAISPKTREGKHTTASSVLLELPGGGSVIDSPGVRDYAPAMQSVVEIIHGFREIELAGQHCRFANCRHLREPGCAVLQAVEQGAVSSRRYDSFRRCVNMLPRGPA